MIQFCLRSRELDDLVRAIGSDDAIIRLDRLLDTHLQHAMALCQAFQAAADRQVNLEIQMACADMLGGPVETVLRWARRAFGDQAIAARVASDTALGTAQKLEGGPEQLQLLAAVG
jgi:hypothetical protein